MIASPRCALCFLLVATVLLVTGCDAEVSTGDGTGIDTASVEQTITKLYPAQSDGLELIAIECEDADAKVGTEFDCAASNDNGVDLEIVSVVTSVDEDSERIKFNFDVTRAVAEGTTFSEVAAKTIGNGVEVECPDGIVIEKGTEVDCVATLPDGSERDVYLTLTDGNGGFNIAPLGPIND
ncbi:MAG: DUF4333 domain-containing protein [Solirubrobacterales bacterium]